ncbi:hypothetical protein KAW80_04545 [Candidatus Babeliales bacterium]|nr:hypothetical protein [Candidatus Babeliales bacterium]
MNNKFKQVFIISIFLWLIAEGPLLGYAIRLRKFIRYSDNKEICLISDWHQSGKYLSKSQKQFLKTLEDLDKTEEKVDLFWELGNRKDPEDQIKKYYGTTPESNKLNYGPFIGLKGYYLSKKNFQNLIFTDIDSQRDDLLSELIFAPDKAKLYMNVPVSRVENFIKKIENNEYLKTKLTKIKNENDHNYLNLKLLHLEQATRKAYTQTIVPQIKKYNIRSVGELIEKKLPLIWCIFPEGLENSITSLNITELETLINIFSSSNKKHIVYVGEYHENNIVPELEFLGFFNTYDSNTSYNIWGTPKELPSSIWNNLYLNKEEIKNCS